MPPVLTEAGCLIETGACDHDLLDADIEFAGLALVEDAGSTRGRARIIVRRMVTLS